MFPHSSVGLHQQVQDVMAVLLFVPGAFIPGTFTCGLTVRVATAALIWFHTHLIPSNPRAFYFNLHHHKRARRMIENRTRFIFNNLVLLRTAK